MQDLIEFFTARLNEDEETAKAAMYSPESRWEFGGEGSLSESGTGGNGYFATGPWGGGIEDEHGRHIVAWQPARVLADVASKRKVLGWAKSCLDDRAEAPSVTWAVRVLCEPFAGHPDYRAEW